MKMTEAGNWYTWDDDNSKWRVRSGNLYATAALPTSGTYTIEDETFVFDSTTNTMKMWNGSAWTQYPPAATESTAGMLETATDAEAQAQAADDKILVPDNLAALTATTDMQGLVEKSTSAENTGGTATDKFPDVAGTKEMIETFAGVVQSTFSEYTDNAEASGTIPVDDTAPQWNEGFTVVERTITPTSNDNKVLVIFNGCFGSDHSSADKVVVALFQGQAGSAICSVQKQVPGGAAASHMEVFTLIHIIESPGTSEITLSIQVGAETGNATPNGVNNGGLMGATAKCTLLALEIR
jgi:hypothetical protein